MREKRKAFEHVSTYLVKPFFVQREKAKKGSMGALLVKEANHSTPKPFNRFLFVLRSFFPRYDRNPTNGKPRCNHGMRGSCRFLADRTNARTVPLRKVRDSVKFYRREPLPNELEGRRGNICLIPKNKN